MARERCSLDTLDGTCRGFRMTVDAGELAAATLTCDLTADVERF